MKHSKWLFPSVYSPTPGIVEVMRRQFIASILLLAVTFHGSLSRRGRIYADVHTVRYVGGKCVPI
jgi:hypothetical protein